MDEDWVLQISQRRNNLNNVEMKEDAILDHKEYERNTFGDEGEF